MGTIMHKGEMYGAGGSNSNLITLKWAEYDALPAADKADLDKYYYIDDLNTGSDLVTQISNPADNQFLMYDSSKGLWVNHAGGLYQYIPLTEDEYNALTTEQKNDPSKLYYVTDVDVVNANIDDTTISTEKVWSSSKTNSELSTLNSNLTDVEETVTANELGTYVNISSYTSDWYICPSDGYIHIRCNTAGTTMQARITGPTGGVDLYLKAIGASGGVFDSISVRKGMKVKMIKTGSGDAYGYFVPLE
jgi:hypothetical protein